MAYYQKWMQNRFPRARAYVLCLVAISLCAFVIWWAFAQYSETPFDLTFVARSIAIFAPAGCLLIYVVRLASVGASWVIARQATEILKSGHREKALELFHARYRDIHPLVVNHPAFQALLSQVWASVDSAHPQVSGWRGTEVEIERKSKLVSRCMLVCFLLLLVITGIRLIWAASR